MAAMASPRVVLHQFPASHFNEKARWALDWKGIAHRRVSYLPGPHLPQIRRLSGQSQTPVLVLDGEAIPGSARILAALDERFPERPLLPADPAERERALSLEARFDAEVGPAVRTAVFSVLIDEEDHLVATFGAPKPAPVRWLYRRFLPLAKGLIAKANDATDPDDVERSFEQARQALDFVAEQSRATGVLVGNRFGLADLCCAALLAPLVDPKHPDMAKPRPIPARIEAFLERWASHPGAQWVLAQYARNRPPSCEVRS